MKTRLYIIFALLLSVALIAGCSKQSSQQQQSQGGENAQATDTTGMGQTPTDQATTQPPATDKPVAQKPTGETTTQKKDTPTKKEEPPKAKVVTLPESSLVKITLIDSIDTDIHVTGTEFRAEILENVVYNGDVLFEKGAQAVGVLNKVVESGRLKTPAELAFSLISIADRTGKQVQIDTYPIEEKKDSHTKEQVGLIGGGALVGGIIGKVTGKKGGTEIGAVAGAAAGAAAAAAAGKNDITLHAGTQVQFLLRAPVDVTVPPAGQMAKD